MRPLHSVQRFTCAASNSRTATALVNFIDFLEAFVSPSFCQDYDERADVAVNMALRRGIVHID
jgi:hypothetical protein